MRSPLFLSVLLVALAATPQVCCAQSGSTQLPTTLPPANRPTDQAQNSPEVKRATHIQALSSADMKTSDLESSKRIRDIVLNQSDDGRALAHLVQLTRQLPRERASQIYFNLSTDYLNVGKYNQAGDVLKQMLNQYPDQPLACAAINRIVRLYSSSEISHTQQKLSGPADIKSYCVYAQYLANEAVRKNTAFSKLPELSFQRAVATRLSGNLKAAQGRLSSLKRQPNANEWRTRALAEKWLLSERKDESHVPTVACRQTNEKPHLDGKLNDSFWQTDMPVQFAYDQEFLYLAITYPKVEGQDYTPDTRPRTYDADLSGHDHLQIRLDADRDYATCFELAVDHRGWTSDKCWLDAGWNLKWFVAADGDETTWTVEAAIPWEQLCAVAPSSGESWVVGWKRVLATSKKVENKTDTPIALAKFDAGMMGRGEAKTPKSVTGGQDAPDAEATSPRNDEFRLLLFQ